jgi:TRAP-type C4-dicarboxylate transport system permease large subunit
MTFAAGIVVGLALGLVIVGFLAIAAYQRGYDEAFGRRKEWRAELVARKAAVRNLVTATSRKAS